MYTDRDFQTKKELKEAVAKGDKVRVVSSGPFPAPTQGRTAVEGPKHRAHTWYASVEVKDGIITRVR